MSNQVASLLARVYACHARICGMRAENQACGWKNQSPAYNKDAFWEEAQELERLGDLLRDYYE